MSFQDAIHSRALNPYTIFKEHVMKNRKVLSSLGDFRMSRFAVERVDDYRLKTVPKRYCSEYKSLTADTRGHPPVLQRLYISHEIPR